MTPNTTDKLELDEARVLIGDRLPKFKNTLPAAWWIATDPRVVDGYDRYRSSYDAWNKKVFDVADDIGVKTARISWFGVHGYEPTDEMRAGRTVVPVGWRIDSKSGHLVPSRRTKADREAATVQRFKELGHAPQESDFLPTMDIEVRIPTGNGFSFRRYEPHYCRVANAVIAVMNADPDRVPDSDSRVDTATWHRQKLSVLHALVEEAGDA
ncbi:Uncharacterised protein (plasmid) [Tsukamurella tyrosinosolvens]|uniref:Uncharacterized protein n=1 Tax=Tsukamurella tyrosinosolvens TaxID=57704 RepID=A0A1H4UDV3_TSUTY|nr:hypothetical protein [Tsukamurella tyrosinosolvens]KXO92952.1 hypothetical protein AXK58_13865 [Tsukamurella tyrosinosolvens]SEC66780.1 hypothetical protein SAMN04489793_2864 [Tsukamurella tyrosinosolvens]VEH94149.1 Uncharacterised protein [Tsukamurella tyrosinosolvens]